MPKISLSGPADLLTILPFHLGFQPTRSVVVVCFHGKRLGLVARFDLVPAALADASAAVGLPTLVRDRPSGVCLVGFEDEAGESDPLAEALRAGLEREGVDVGDRLVVRDGRWFTAGCDCCPPGGRPMPELADVPAVADYVALGHSVLGDRTRSSPSCDPPPTPTRCTRRPGRPSTPGRRATPSRSRSTGSAPAGCRPDGRTRSTDRPDRRWTRRWTRQRRAATSSGQDDADPSWEDEVTGGPRSDRHRPRDAARRAPGVLVR